MYVDVYGYVYVYGNGLERIERTFTGNGNDCEREEGKVSEHIFKTIELTGSSEQGVQHAIENAIERATKSVRHMRWFEVTEVRGHIEESRIRHWQVTLKIGFALED